jgi:hypothetical protein
VVRRVAKRHPDRCHGRCRGRHVDHGARYLDYPTGDIHHPWFVVELERHRADTGVDADHAAADADHGTADHDTDDVVTSAHHHDSARKRRVWLLGRRT